MFSQMSVCYQGRGTLSPSHNTSTGLMPFLGGTPFPYHNTSTSSMPLPGGYPSRVRMGRVPQLGQDGYPPGPCQDGVPLPARSGWGYDGVPPGQGSNGVPSTMSGWGIPPDRDGVPSPPRRTSHGQYLLWSVHLLRSHAGGLSCICFLFLPPKERPINITIEFAKR